MMGGRGGNGGGATRVEGRIRSAYESLPKAPGGWVGLADLRSKLGGLARDDVDAALGRLARQPGVRVAPFDNTRSLSRRDRDAAVLLGITPRHMISIRESR
jgi:hypothetical protein